MTSQETNLLLVFIWGLIALKSSGALKIQPENPVVILSENNKIGDIVLNLTVRTTTSGGILNVHLTESKKCLNLTKLKLNVTCSTTCKFSIRANSVLDRESACSTFSLSVSYELQKNNGRRKRYIFVLNDVNDNPPQFEHLPYKTSIPEDLSIGSPLSGLTISAKDADSGPNAQFTYTLIPSGQNSANINDVMSINDVTGVITLKKKLDYETRNFYQYSVIVTDEGKPPLNLSASVWIEIIDVQDSPPVFIKPSIVAHINENAPNGTSVMSVSAEDGDRGNPNEIFYEIRDDICKRFWIDTHNGVIFAVKKLNLTIPSLKKNNGNCPVIVIAKEVNNTSSCMTQNVTILIKDINDHGPTFSQNVYTANVSEAAIVDNSIKLDKAIHIVDEDQQIENRKFRLTLEHLNDTAFTALRVSPDERSTATDVSLLVSDTSQLDYERMDGLCFKIIAKGTKGKFSSSATVNLNILPFNEYRPTFKSNYTAYVFENVTPGHEVTHVLATDADRGYDGNITYRLYGSNGLFFQEYHLKSPNTLHVIHSLYHNQEIEIPMFIGVSDQIVHSCTIKISANIDSFVERYTGNVTVGPKIPDYEQVQFYQLTVEATDGGNRRGTAYLSVYINDTNDEAPIFTPSRYEGTMTENEHFAITVKAEDKDKPGSPNSEVRYAIESVSENLKNNFTINKTTGEIETNSIDYEKLNSNQIVLVVRASDQGNPQLSGTTNVTIDIKDANDNSPIFTRPIYYFNVSEDLHTGFNIGNVSAKDADRGKINNEITYLLPNEIEKFRINSLNGSISILGKLDRENCDHYFLLVEAIDRGTPSASGSAFLNITVTDINDETPVLENSPEIQIAENATIGSFIVKINATDADSNPRLNYSIYSQRIQMDGKGMFVNTPSSVRYFRINETTGEIFVNNTLDRETAELISLGIEVRDMNAVGNEQSSKGEQKITILDVNDNHPKFLEKQIKLSRNENLSVNATLTKMIATDADKDDNVTYQFETNYKQFRINNITGEITLANSLDRETNSTMTLIVLAVDSIPKCLTSTATIVLDILDSNDNSPIFPTGMYKKIYNVKEDAAIGHDIVTVHAMDADIGINAEIRYSLIYRDGGPTLPISINYTMGNIYVSKTLDRETTPSYSIEVEAIDMRGQQAEARTGSMWIKINVTDVNDNAPFFESTSYSASVQEDKKTDQSILQVRATDKDIGENKKLSFSLEGNGSALFKIGLSNGIIHMKSSLVDQVGVKRFSVVVTDHGSPVLNNTANVTVNITDTNNHPPRFTMTNWDHDVPEDTCPGSSILDIAATDDDVYPQNKKVTYILKKGKDSNFFQLNSNSGRLTLQEKMDREKQAIYKVEIIARDNGKPSLEATCLVRINATNVDDEPPRFMLADYPGFTKGFSVVEGKPKLFIGKIKAVDEDPDSTPCYKIIPDKNNNNNNYNNNNDDDDGAYFEINPLGEIHTQKEIDYEKKKDFNFIVETYDCNNKIYDKCDNSTTINDNLLSVVINITDVNDNPPRFLKKSMREAIEFDVTKNSIIVNLMSKITDADEYPENNENSFRIFDFIKHGDLSAKKMPFLVDNANLRTNQLFDTVQMGYIQFSILAFDSLGQNDTAIMKVYVVGKGNQIIVMLLQTFEETENIKETFCRQLGLILGNNITIVAGKIESYQESDGTYDKRKTSMYIYGIEGGEDGEIMLAEKLQRLMDFKTKELSGLLNAHSVIHIGSLEQKGPASSNSSKEQAILFGVIAILTVSLFAIVLLFYGSNQRFKRKLKAAKIDVHSNKQDFEKWTTVPGSNVHALKESNPIYNKEINHVLSLSEKVSLNSLDMNEVQDSAIFVDPYDEQEIAVDFIEDSTNETSPTSQDYSRTFLNNVIKEREAEMNKKNQNTGSMSGYTNMTLSVTDLVTTDV